MLKKQLKKDLSHITKTISPRHERASMHSNPKLDDNDSKF